jgi:uncharacterized protein
MEFEWDDAKSAANLAKHGMSFEKAIAIFSDEDALSAEDGRYQYDEPRYSVTGFIQGRLHVVISTIRNECIRIISARKANEREQRKHGNRPL